MRIALVVGAGPQGRNDAEILQAQGGWGVIEFIDDDPALWGQVINGVTVSGGMASLPGRRREELHAVVALGNPIARLRVVRQLEAMEIPFLTAIHPNATVSPSARIGKGVTIEPSAVVSANAVLGNHVYVMLGAMIGHDAIIAEGATVTACVLVSSRVQIGRWAFLCDAATILPRRSVGAGSIVAAGALVTRDVPPGVLVLGVPAHRKEDVGPDFDWSRIL
jgi:sugar O-acyltransferase (sialic acid O-acetyltransferase NeuD family)